MRKHALARGVWPGGMLPQENLTLTTSETAYGGSYGRIHKSKVRFIHNITIILYGNFQWG